MSYQNGYEKLKREKRGYKILFIAVGIALTVQTVVGAVEARQERLEDSLIWPISKKLIVIPERIIYRDVVRWETPGTIEEEIIAVFGDDAEVALRVAECESNLNPRAENSESSARGIFQILAYTHEIKEEWLFNPSINIRAAKQLFDVSGWEPWESSEGCWSN